MAVFNVARGLW